MPFAMSQNCKMQGCQKYIVKRIKSHFNEYRELWKKVWGTPLLPQVVLISSTKTNFKQYFFTVVLGQIAFRSIS